ncbi:hypothetical protein YPPY94_2935, partial [Yersinia pestis PY-94]
MTGGISIQNSTRFKKNPVSEMPGSPPD